MGSVTPYSVIYKAHEVETKWWTETPKLVFQSARETADMEIICSQPLPLMPQMIDSDQEWQGPGSPLGNTGSTDISHKEPWVKMTVGNRLVDFLIDTGPTFSVLNSKLAKASSEIVTVSKTSPKALLEATGVSDRRLIWSSFPVHAWVSNTSAGTRLLE